MLRMLSVCMGSNFVLRGSGSSHGGSLRSGIVHLCPQSLVKNFRNWVPTANVASLADNAKPQEKEQQIFKDFLPDFEALGKDELQTYLDLEIQDDFFVDTGRSKHYEIMFIIHENNADEVEAVMDKVTDFAVENKGFSYSDHDWGMRRLAHKIREAEKGNYVMMNIVIGAGFIDDLNSMFEEDERVIRHMVMSQKETVSWRRMICNHLKNLRKAGK